MLLGHRRRVTGRCHRSRLFEGGKLEGVGGIDGKLNAGRERGKPRVWKGNRTVLMTPWHGQLVCFRSGGRLTDTSTKA